MPVMGMIVMLMSRSALIILMMIPRLLNVIILALLMILIVPLQVIWIIMQFHRDST